MPHLRFQWFGFFAILSIASGVIHGCAYRGPVDNPVASSVTWFSYVGAEDIKAACGPGSPNAFRFVYNGLYRRHVRTYDIVLGPGGRDATLRATAREPADLSRGLTLSSPFRPWQGKSAETPLQPNDLVKLRETLDRDGFFSPGPQGLRLPSDEFYWVAAACVNGRFLVNAWRYPSNRFARLTLPAFLLGHDRTRVEFYAPRPEDDRPPGYRGAPEDDDIRLQIPFEFRLDGHRLYGAGALFGGPIPHQNLALRSPL